MADKFDITTVKNMDTKSILATAKQLRGEIAELIVDKNLNKLKDLKSMDKKRKNLARVLTVLNQKQVLEKLEAGKEAK
jgi:ribosomal protein L29